MGVSAEKAVVLYVTIFLAVQKPQKSIFTSITNAN
jgi:hypothetical protein